MRASILFLLVFNTFLIANPVSTCFADDNETAERFHFIIDGMKSEREKIVSGVVRGKGERTLTREINGKSVTDIGPVEYFLAFDFLEENMRVDRKELGFLVDGGYEPWLGQYIEKKDSMEYCSYSPEEPLARVILVARPKEGDYEFRNKRFCHPLDIRNIGLFDLWRFTHGNAASFDARMDRLKNRIPEILVEEENGVVRYEYHQRVEGELRRSVLWLDTKNGYTRIRSLSIWEFDSDEFQPWILEDIRVSWKKNAGVWVPIDIVFEKNLPVTEKEKFVMTFDWENVNKPVDEEYFTYCDFEVSEHTPVVSVPTKALVTTARNDRLGDYINLCGTKEGRLLMKQLEEKKFARWTWTRWTLMAAGIILIFIGFGLRLKKKMNESAQVY